MGYLAMIKATDYENWYHFQKGIANGFYNVVNTVLTLASPRLKSEFCMTLEIGSKFPEPQIFKKIGNIPNIPRVKRIM